MALVRSGRYRVLGIARKSRTRRLALRRRAAHEVSAHLDDAGRCDLVILCTPVRSLPAAFSAVLPFLKPGTVVSDVGSVKTEFMAEIARRIRGSGVRFVSAHPMAGSHKSGLRVASPDLFKGAGCAVLPLAGAAPGPVLRAWRTVGARPFVISAAAHDAAVALTSHLPHVIAHALVHAARRHREPKALRSLMGGSFRDVTRVASSDPDQWTDIFNLNAKRLKPTLQAFSRELQRLSRLIGRPDSLRRHLEVSKRWREPLFDGL